MSLLKTSVMSLACLCLLMSIGMAAGEMRTVVDGRGVSVTIGAEIERVVTISDDLIESLMFCLGEEDKIVGVGSSSVQKGTNRNFTTVSGETYEYRGGMNPAPYLIPRLRDLPLVASSGTGINYETLAGLDPDLVILRVGDCTFGSMDEGAQKAIRTIEGLGIPVVVLKAHPCFDEPDFSTIYDEIRIIGDVFGNKERASELADYIESQTQLVFERTKDIPDAEKMTILEFGASPKSREAGGAGTVKGTDTIESYSMEEIVHAKNAYQDTGSPTISDEQLLSLDPDVIVLGTAWGYHPASELYTAPYYQNVGELSAVKDRRVYAFPYTSSNCARRFVYPIEVMIMAKACYPDRFEDIKVHEWVLDFYKNVYGVDEETAKGLRSAQWLDWLVEEDF